MRRSTSRIRPICATDQSRNSWSCTPSTSARANSERNRSRMTPGSVTPRSSRATGNSVYPPGMNFGFSDPDLFLPERLADLDALFRERLGRENPDLAARFERYRAHEPLRARGAVGPPRRGQPAARGVRRGAVRRFRRARRRAGPRPGRGGSLQVPVRGLPEALREEVPRRRLDRLPRPRRRRGVRKIPRRRSLGRPRPRGRGAPRRPRGMGPLRPRGLSRVAPLARRVVHARGRARAGRGSARRGRPGPPFRFPGTTPRS